MTTLANYFGQGSNSSIRLSNLTNWSYKGRWIQVFTDTEVDRWHLGEFSSATYQFNIEFDSNKKEVIQAIVVARPSEASILVYGRNGIDDDIVTLTATVNDSYVSIIANVTNSAFLGSKIMFISSYAECMNELSYATARSFLPTSGVGGGEGSSGGGSSGVGVLNDLLDVVSINPINGQILKYNGASWVNSFITSTAEFNAFAPIAPLNGSLWYDTLTDSLYIYYSETGLWNSAVKSFRNISIAGQSDVTADSGTDTLTLVAGTGIALGTTPGTNSVTITSAVASYSMSAETTTGGVNLRLNGSDATTDDIKFASTSGVTVTRTDADTITLSLNAGIFTNIEVAGQGTVIADAISDTLTLEAGDGIVITTAPTTDTVTITSTGATTGKAIAMAIVFGG